MKRTPYTPDLLDGMNTTADENGMELPYWVLQQNVRFHTGNASRRGGSQRIDRVVSPHTSMNMNGTSHVITVPLDTRVWTLGKRWTIEMLFSPDDTTGTQTIQSFDHASTWPVQFELSGTTLNVSVTDTADAVVTLTATVAAGTTYAVQLVRDGTALTLRVNGAVTATDTDTMADLNCKVPANDLLFMRDVGTDFANVTIDFFRLWNSALTDQKYGVMRLPDPRLSDLILADYVFEVTETTTVRIDDRSHFGNHGLLTGAAAVTATALTRQVTPINLIEPWLGEDGKSRIAVIGGSEIHLADTLA